jgi:hypothetical protein
MILTCLGGFQHFTILNIQPFFSEPARSLSSLPWMTTLTLSLL